MPFSDTAANAVFDLANKPTPLGRKVKSALAIIDRALAEYGKKLAISFNGGKDCTVMLHLLRASLSRHPQYSSTPFKSLYVRCASPFPQVEQFVDHCAQYYSLDLVTITKGMKAALGDYLQLDDQVQAVLIGTRRGDPFTDTLEDFTPTDPDWPPLMRVHPILDWTYSEIWEYLRYPVFVGLGLSWCSLYSEGYTSLGSTFNTSPNPCLQSDDGGWRPAWELEDASLERAGRHFTPPNGTV